MPTIVVVGRGLADGVIEVRDRRSGERMEVAGGRRARARSWPRCTAARSWAEAWRVSTRGDHPRAADPGGLRRRLGGCGGGRRRADPAPGAAARAAGFHAAGHILGTNKVSSVWGTATSSITYAVKIRPDWRTIVPLVVGSAVGSAMGALLARYLPRTYFTPIVLAALIGVGLYTWRRPELGLVSRRKHDGRAHYGRTALIGLGRRRVRRVPRARHRLVLRDLAGRRARLRVSRGQRQGQDRQPGDEPGGDRGLRASGSMLWGLGLVMGAANLVGGSSAPGRRSAGAMPSSGGCSCWCWPVW